MSVNTLPSWRALEVAAQRLQTRRITDLFALDKRRLDSFTLSACGIYADFSKNLIDDDAFSHLLKLSRDRHLAQAIENLFTGATVNRTEHRPALHTLLRAENASSAPGKLAAEFAEISAVNRRIDTFCQRIASGELRGYSGLPITNVVNLGIGGSHLGPELVCDALRYDRSGHVDVHFVANVDGGALDKALHSLDPQTTYFIIASKSFTTPETLLNAESAKAWILREFGDPKAIAAHFSAVTASPEVAQSFGIDTRNVLPMWDWVGGRYSLWSAIGLPIAAALGNHGFERLLSGARMMDTHFRETELAGNLPVVLALVGVWNCNFLGARTHAVIPYDDRLELLPGYLQQLEMESNGKCVSHENLATEYTTAPVLWGGVGTNGQHAFFQQLHQGTQLTAIDFIVSLTHQRAPRDHHDMLVANCFAQAEALMRGRTRQQASDIADPSAAIDLATHREMPGNRPSTVLALDALTPERLGALLALYEHKAYVQGVIWDIDSFDQWGVELGKSFASTVLSDFHRTSPPEHDPSTNALIERYRNANPGKR